MKKRDCQTAALPANVKTNNFLRTISGTRNAINTTLRFAANHMYVHHVIHIQMIQKSNTHYYNVRLE